MARLQKARPVAGGGIAVPAYLTRVGVLDYRNADGSTRRELRLPEEVFAADSLATLAHAPVTVLHPPEMVNAKNWRQYGVGAVSENVKADSGYIASSLIVNDADAISKIERRDLQEISCGYSCDLETTSGEYNGVKYDAIQRNIRYNHVALGPDNWGRAGSNVALRLDAGDAYTYQESNPAMAPDNVRRDGSNRAMKFRITLDGVTYEVDADPSFEQAFKKHQDSIAASMATANGRADAEKGRADAAESKVKELSTRVDSFATDLSKAVSATLKLRTDAAKILPSDYSFDGKAERDVMIAAIKVTDSAFAPDASATDSYLRGRFDALVANAARNDTRERLGGLRQDGGASGGGSNDRLDAAYEKYQTDASEGWKAPLTVCKTPNGARA